MKIRNGDKRGGKWRNGRDRKGQEKRITKCTIHCVQYAAPLR
jgi:hypothetical protein